MGEQAKILLVDDRPANLLALRAILEDLGHVLAEATSGREALDRLGRDDFAVVLLDVQMDGLDGFETAKRIRARERSRHTPIILLTAYESAEFPVERAYELGAVDYLVKPLVPQIVRSKVEVFVELFRKTEQVQRQAERLRERERRDFEEKLAQENARLRESLAFHQAIAELASDFAYSARMDRAAGAVIESATEGFAKVTGYTVAEFNARGGWPAAVLPEDLPVAMRALSQAVAGQKQEDEVRFRTKGGEVRWVRFLGQPVWDEEHRRVIGILGAVKDVTDRKHAQEAVEESELRFRQMAETIQDVFWMTDPQTTELLYISPAYERVWGRTCQSLYQDPRSFADSVHPEDRERVRAALENHGRGEPTDVEYRVVRPDGTLRWVRDRGFPVRDADGRVFRVAGVAQDVTQRKEAEQALREADRAKDEFLAMLAHELRNPLAPIRNALHILKLPAADGIVAGQAREVAERQVRHMARLLDDLLDVSRISRGKIELRREAVDVAAVVGHTVDAVRPLIEERRHELTVSLPGTPLRVDADPTRLEQVLTNLLTNAARYTDPGGRIAVGVRAEGGEVVLAVRDTGVGIAPEMLPRIFDLFVQAERRLDRSQGGVGIGLTLTKKLVELHGGRIEAASEGPGKGSEFVVRLPALAVPAEGGPRPRGAASEPARLPRRRILVVDDNRDAADSLGVLLRLAGQDVRLAYDGPEAIEVARAFRPAVVFLDIGMPGMDGYEVARRLRSEPGMRDVLLVAMTGWGQEEDRRNSEDAGFDHHLVKPTDPEALQDLLGKSP